MATLAETLKAVRDSKKQQEEDNDPEASLASRPLLKTLSSSDVTKTHTELSRPAFDKTMTTTKSLPTDVNPPAFMSPEGQAGDLTRIKQILGNGPVPESEVRQGFKNNPAPYAPDYKPSASELENKTGKNVLGEVDRSKYQGERQKERDLLDKKTNTADWAQVAEMFGHALTKLGAGIYGKKNNANMSGIQLDKVDWDKRRSQLTDNYKSIVDQINREEDKDEKDLDKINKLKVDANKVLQEAEIEQLVKQHAMEFKDYEAKRDAGTSSSTKEHIAPTVNTTDVTRTSSGENPADARLALQKQKMEQPSEGSLKELRKVDSAIESIGQAGKNWDKLVHNEGPLDNMVSWAETHLTPGFNTDPKTYDQMTKALVGTIAKFGGDSGNLSQGDIDRSNNARPLVTDDRETKEQKMNTLIGIMLKGKYNTLKQMDALGKDTGKLWSDWFKGMPADQKALLNAELNGPEE